ncbi:MAG: class I SAM-dependent methyltransferase, partial [Armatimonadota bacterium]
PLVDREMIGEALARRRNRQAVEGGRAAVVVGDAEQLPWPDNTFTCCACVATFLFFERPHAVLREIRRVLGPGGRVVIITPARQPPGFVRSLLAPSEGGVGLYSQEEFEEMLRETGFTDIDVELQSRRLVCQAMTSPDKL